MALYLIILSVCEKYEVFGDDFSEFLFSSVIYFLHTVYSDRLTSYCHRPYPVI